MGINLPSVINYLTIADVGLRLIHKHANVTGQLLVQLKHNNQESWQGKSQAACVSWERAEVNEAEWGHQRGLIHQKFGSIAVEGKSTEGSVRPQIMRISGRFFFLQGSLGV